MGAFDLIELPNDFWSRPDVKHALEQRNIGQLFQLIQQWTGASQMRIGAETGFSQGRVNAIIKGKSNVESLAVFTRIADGLGMPLHARIALGVATTPDSAKAEPDRPESAVRATTHADVDQTQYPVSIEQAVNAVTDLWRSDTADEMLPAQADPGAWNAAALAWLVADPDSVPIERQQGIAVGNADVLRVRAALKLFGQIDNRFGGALARQSLITYLRQDAARLLAGRYTEDVGRDLFSAVAEATLLAAWSSYDAGLHGAAQRYFVQALRLAQAGDDRRLGCSILSAMSHQATFLGHYREALNLGRAARSGLSGVATPALTAQFLAMEARALAGARETSACHAALASAERQLEQANPAIDPEFISYFNEAELSAELAHCFRDLGDSRRAAAHASAAGPQPDGEFARSDFFVTMVLADAYADQDEPEQACGIALDALRIGETITSARCAAYVREFRQRLERFSDSQPTQDFEEQAAGFSLWNDTL